MRARRAAADSPRGDVRAHLRTRGARDARACCWRRRWRTIRGSRPPRRGWGVLGERADRGRRARAGASRSWCRRTSGWRGRWSRSARRSAPTIPRSRAGSARRSPFPSTPRSAMPSARSPGVVSQTVEILVNQPTFKVFRVHDPAGSRDYPEPEPALEHAQRVSRALALAAARRAGAADPHVDTERERKARAGGTRGADYLAEAVVRSTARGQAARRVTHARAYRIKAYRPRRHIENIISRRRGVAQIAAPARRRRSPSSLINRAPHETARRDASDGAAGAGPAAPKPATRSSTARAPIAICAIRSRR